MKTIALSGLVTLFALCGCSSTSSSSNEERPDSLDADNNLRLNSVQITFDSGNTITNIYEYDENGNLTGWSNDNISVIYSIEANGRIIGSKVSIEGSTFRDLEIYHYDEIGGLRRTDFLGFIEGVGTIGVSSIDVYKFEGDLATTLESRRIPFEDININIQPDDSAGIVVSNTTFEYEGDRLIRELIDSNGDDEVDTQRDYTYNSDGTLSSTLTSVVEAQMTSASSRVYSYEQGACNHNWGNSTHRYFCVVNEDL